MKKQIIALLAGAMLMMAVNASAYTIGSTDIGLADTIVGRTDLPNSGSQNEVDWVNGLLSPAGTFVIADLTKYTDTHALEIGGVNQSPTPGNWNWILVTGSIYAMELYGAPEYFYIKTGNLKLGNPNPEHFLFHNTSGTDWAVVDLSEMNSNAADINIGKFSHLGELGGNTPPVVPEPGTMVLLGFGMLGLAVYGKRRMNREA
ncbi:MAG: PEP-CTERM sorting domain-containing protein [Desulfuromonadaceae bacterium]